MIVCKGCGSPVSKNAAACPKCGEPPPIAKFSNGFAGTVLGMAAFFGLILGGMYVLGVFH